MTDRIPLRKTTELLEQWREGDEEAVNAIISRHLDRVRSMVRTRCGTQLRKRLQTEDFVQEAFLAFLKYGPPVKPENGAQFRRLMSKSVESSLKDIHGWFDRRRPRLAQAHNDNEVIELNNLADPGAAAPDDRSIQTEAQRRLRFVLELVGPLSREIFLARTLDGTSFVEIGKQHDMLPDAARMRFSRISEDLKRLLANLRRKSFDDWLDSLDADGYDEVGM